MTHNPVFPSRIKHIDNQDDYIQKEMVSKKIEILNVLIKKMIVDGLTKVLTHIKFLKFVNKIKINKVTKIYHSHQVKSNTYIKGHNQLDEKPRANFSPICLKTR